MNGRKAKQLRKENEVVVVLDKPLAQWLLGFFVTLGSTFGPDSLNSDTISARQVARAIQKGLDDAEETTA